MKKLVAITLLAAMLLSCFAGCVMQKGEVYAADEANVAEVDVETDVEVGDTIVIGIKDDLRVNVNAAKKGTLTFADPLDGTTESDAWYTNAKTVDGKTTASISSAAELVNFRTKMATETFAGWTITLAANIDLGGATLIGIGTQFAGTFDGDNHVIYNYKMSLAASTGFFGNIQGTGEQPASVKNVAFVNATCTASAGNVGSVAGNVKGTANIENVYSNATMAAGASVTKVGGLFGSVTFTGTKTITNCEFGGAINSENTGNVYLGGIAASVNGGDVTFSYCAIAEGAAVNGKGSYVGGIFAYGNTAYTLKVSHCVNNGALTGINGVGGLVAQYKKSTATIAYEIEYSTNNGTITGTGTYTGGIIGEYNQACGLIVTDCTNNGAVSGKTNTGGVLGGTAVSSATVSIKGSTNNGTVTGTEEVGGIIGHVESGTINLTNCKNKGSITGDSGVYDVANEGIAVVRTNLVMAGYQFTKVEGGKYDLRFVAAFDDDNAKAAGFVVSVYYKDANGNRVAKFDAKTVYTEKVYTSIKGVDDKGNVLTYTASDFGGKYFYTLAIKGIPADYTIADGTLEVLITPFTAVEEEGKIVKTEYKTEQYPLHNLENLKKYVIVYKKGSTALKNAAETFQKYTKEYYGVELPVVDDSTPETVYEFLIGNVNRSLATEYLQKEEAKSPIVYVTAVKNKKLLFATQNDEIVERSMESFCKKYVASGDSFLLQLPVSFEEFNSAFDFSETTELAAGANLRVMSFNILCELYAANAVIEGRQLPVVAPIFTYMPDVLGMQEVTDAWYPYLYSLFGDTYKIADQKDNSGGTNWSPLAYNTKTLTLLDHGAKRLQVGGNGHRVMSWGYFERKSDGARFVVINTHWNIGGDANKVADQVAQAKEMAAFALTLKNKYKCPIITTGDHNSRLSEDPIKTYITNSGLLDACQNAKVVNRAIKTTHTLFSENTRGEGEAIDHIFASSDVELLYYNVLIDKCLAPSSDHYPIYVDIKLNK